MNLLQLCQTVIERCNIPLTGAFITAQNQTGELLQAVNWVKQSWLEIQLSQSNWDWMRSEFTFNTQVGKQDYTLADISLTDHAKWHLDTLRFYKTSTGVSDDTFFEFEGWSAFRDMYMYGAQTNSRPSVFTVRRRDKALLLGAIPDAVYTVYGEYQKSSTALSADLDEPDMPSDYHMLVVHRARMKYAASENAPEVFAEAQADHEWLMGKLVELHIDEIGLGAPLA